MKKQEYKTLRIPRATYRLQCNKYFRFSDAKKIISYLASLGISDIYTSPYFKAKPDSLHGYDIVDHSAFNVEIGTEADFDDLITELRKHTMGHILDIVPNHMCIESSQNKWWMDVLENGPSSDYAHYFDIEWMPAKKELRNRILIPILGDQYGKVLEDQGLKLTFEEGSFFVDYFDKRFPIRPETYTLILHYRINTLEKKLSANNPYFIELLKIVAMLAHLPSYTRRDVKNKKKRNKEKSIIKTHLLKLYDESAEIREFIDENIRLINGRKGDPKSYNLLDRLLNRQVYRLSFWRVATEEINYRRFFDINNLGSIRMEARDVFEETHRLISRLMREEKVTGLRVDHPDGLYDPTKYFQHLQRMSFVELRMAHLSKITAEVASSSGRTEVKKNIDRIYDEMLVSDPLFKPFYIVGEKILSKGEKIPEDWPVFSTTGYDFLNSLNGIFVESARSKAFNDIYARFTRLKRNYHDIVYESKKLIMQASMSSEINTLGHYLDTISEKNRHTRDFTLNSLTAVIMEVVGFFPVYRTYINSLSVSDRDRQYIELAVYRAKRKNPAINESIFDFLKDVLLLDFPDEFHNEDKKGWLDFVMKFQQVTGPVMAKGLEDTAFYQYNRLSSLNEVGGSPDRFGIPLETFHGQNIERAKKNPHALLTTSTHDTKRSEDVRARINVLSEMPDEWKKQISSWSRINRNKKIIADGKPVPDRNEEYLLYQTLIGIWPLNEMGEREYNEFIRRIENYMIKALREAKVNTSWTNYNTLYEEAVLLFLQRILDRTLDNQFIRELQDFQKKVSCYGMYKSLSQTLLKMTSPGIPDFYQGNEIWVYNLVDPDNRRPVDYDKRITLLAELKALEKKLYPLELAQRLMKDKDNGLIKLFIIYKILNYREKHSELFEKGEYVSLDIEGEYSDALCAFSRRSGKKRIIVIAPRYVTCFIDNPWAFSVKRDFEQTAFLVVSFGQTGEQYRNIFTGEVLTVVSHNDASALHLSKIFAEFPVAVLEKMH